MCDRTVDGVLEVPTGRLRSCGRERRARALVRAHFDSVWRVLRRLGVASADVDDAAQQVFWVAVRKITPEPSPTDGAFLLSIAIRVAAEYRRRARNRRETLGHESFERPDPGRTPEERVELKRAVTLADRILESMPWEQRVVFVLYEIEEQTTPEIAHLLQIPVGTAASRLRRARESFAEGVARLRARHAMGGRRCTNR